MLDQAKAKKDQDVANLANTQKNLQRDQTLLTKGGYATQQTVDNEQAQVQILKSTIEGDEAAIEAAQINLEFATVTAPFPGVMSLRNVDLGNLVTPSTSIGTVTQIEPIAVDFTLPQGDLGDVRKAAGKGDPLVLAYDQAGKALLSKGILEVINNQIDQASGTIKLKARFDNQDHKLWPGEFVQVAIVVRTEPKALAAPSEAVQRGPNGPYVWLVSKDQTANRRPVQIGEIQNGVTVIEKRAQARRPHRANRSIRHHTRRAHCGKRSSADGGNPSAIMNISAPFIARPIATSLLMIAIAVVGIAAYPLLPVAPLPTVDFPTIQVTAQLPGASPDVMAASVATPLEKQIGIIPGVSQMTSASFLGTTQVTVQFDLNRNIDAAAQDVQTAINAAGGQLPKNLPSPPTYRKVNPADPPIMILSVSSDDLPITQVDDYAENMIALQMSQISRRGSGSGRRSSRRPRSAFRSIPLGSARMGLSLSDVQVGHCERDRRGVEGHDPRPDAKLFRSMTTTSLRRRSPITISSSPTGTARRSASKISAATVEGPNGYNTGRLGPASSAR